jgi:hypothetical protein
MSPDVERLWQQGAGFKTEPEQDIGSKVRAEMPAVPRSGETPSAPSPSEVPEGHTEVDSSAIKSFKHDPAAKEIDITTPTGGRYVYGDISPERAEAFSKGEFIGKTEDDAPSFGKAWKDIRDSGTLIKKNVNGKLVPVTPKVRQ